MKVLFTESKFWATRKEFKTRYEGKVTRAYAAAAKLLQKVPTDLTFVVQDDIADCIPETGDGGYTKNYRLVILSIDPGLPYGEERLLQQVRTTVFHELSHVSRFAQDIWHHTFLDKCVFEGLATAFERDYGDSKPLYGEYNELEAIEWIEEIQAAGSGADYYEYMFRHSDGRRWIGYKVGTYVVDQAKEKSGKSVIELTNMQCDDILKLAQV